MVRAGKSSATVFCASVQGLIVSEGTGKDKQAVKAAPSNLSPSGYSNHAIHLVRNAQIQGLKFSQMADQKASILMGATFVVFSISVSRSLAGDMPYSLGILAVFAFLSSLCAVMAVMPSVKKPKPDPNYVPNKLFFGHYANRDETEWTEELLEELKADETVFRTMLHDIYQNGQIMQNRKYKFLGLAYRVFVSGLILTMIGFILELFWF